MPGPSAVLSGPLADFCGVIQEAQRNAPSFDVDDLHDARRWFLEALPEEAIAELERRSRLVAERVQTCLGYRDNKNLAVCHCLDALLPELRGQASELRGQELSLSRGPHSDSAETRNRLTEIRNRLVEILRTKLMAESLVNLVCEAETEEDLEVQGEEAIKPFVPFLADHLKTERRLLAAFAERAAFPSDEATADEAWGKAAEKIERETRPINADGYHLLWCEEEFRAATDAPPKDDEDGIAVGREMRNEVLKHVKEIAEELVGSGRQTGKPAKGMSPEGLGQAKTRGRKKDPFTKPRADFAKPMREEGHDWPEIATKYKREHSEDTEFPSGKIAGANLIRRAHEREHPDK